MALPPLLMDQTKLGNRFRLDNGYTREALIRDLAELTIALDQLFFEIETQLTIIIGDGIVDEGVWADYLLEGGT